MQLTIFSIEAYLAQKDNLIKKEKDGHDEVIVDPYMG